MYNDVITLVQENYKDDDYGDLILEKVKRAVFAEFKSISQTEFYQAQSVGMKPEIKFELADYYDYQDEKKLIYDEKEYSIIRTYRNGTKLEITCKRGVD